jgi:hypothetical protein
MSAGTSPGIVRADKTFEDCSNREVRLCIGIGRSGAALGDSRPSRTCRAVGYRDDVGLVLETSVKDPPGIVQADESYRGG